LAIEHRYRPTCLLLSRQVLPHLERTREQLDGIQRGAYILRDPEAGEPEAIIIATGSEVSLAVDAYKALTAKGRRIRVVSMPSWDMFETQEPGYREHVLPDRIFARVSVEAGRRQSWFRYVGRRGRAIGVPRFGESAPAAEVFKHFDVTTEAVIAAVEELI
jgi:transketolase